MDKKAGCQYISTRLKEVYATFAEQLRQLWDNVNSKC